MSSVLKSFVQPEFKLKQEFLLKLKAEKVVCELTDHGN